MAIVRKQSRSARYFGFGGGGVGDVYDEAHPSQSECPNPYILPNTGNATA